MVRNTQNPVIDIVKLFLLLGVVSIHCNVLTPDAVFLHGTGADIVTFFSSSLTRICVPSFFIISGFLFFINQDKFNFQVYKDKLHRRFYTLLIPYILWNLISLFLQILKIKYLGFPDHGLFENGNINLIKVFQGFYDYVDGYPFAFAFWFIRNLMVFIVLSPIIYFLRLNKLSIGLILIIGCAALNTTLWYFIFFVMGGIMAKYFKNYIFQVPFYAALACGVLWMTLAVVNVFVQFDYLSSAFLIIESMTALIFIVTMVEFINRGFFKNMIAKILPATFFIYSFHQLCCSVIRNFYIGIFGMETSGGIILSYLFSFITMVGISYLIWLILKYICPSVLNILCGNRGNPPLKNKSLCRI